MCHPGMLRKGVRHICDNTYHTSAVLSIVNRVIGITVMTVKIYFGDVEGISS